MASTIKEHATDRKARMTRIDDLRDAITGKLESEGICINSPWEEIRACLEQTVAPGLCLKIAEALKFETGYSKKSRLQNIKWLK